MRLARHEAHVLTHLALHALIPVANGLEIQLTETTFPYDMLAHCLGENNESQKHSDSSFGAQCRTIDPRIDRRVGKRFPHRADRPRHR